MGDRVSATLLRLVFCTSGWKNLPGNIPLVTNQNTIPLQNIVRYLPVTNPIFFFLFLLSSSQINVLTFVGQVQDHQPLYISFLPSGIYCTDILVFCCRPNSECPFLWGGWFVSYGNFRVITRQDRCKHIKRELENLWIRGLVNSCFMCS